MTLHFEDDWLTVHHGDAATILATLPAESVNCVVTSPPYWGLRDYGEPGQLGLEPTPEAYVEALVAVFREVRRVLRADGTVWLNLGDSYASTPAGNTTWNHGEIFDGRDMSGHHTARRSSTVVGSLKPKDLVGIPWMVAFALRADGWYLRSDIIWSKPNPMPESVTDRPTKSHEYLFLLAKSARYFFDAEAVRESADLSRAGHAQGRWGNTQKASRAAANLRSPSGNEARGVAVIGGTERNVRSVWTVATQPYPGAHFATFPPKLIEPCIKAGTSEKGVCPECGSPWEREVERGETIGRRDSGGVVGLADAGMYRGRAGETSFTTTGWRPSCRCEHDGGGWAPVPATILDPFAGSGTTGLVAQRLSRRAVLIDLSMDYLDQLMDRNRDIPLGLGA